VSSGKENVTVSATERNETTGKEAKDQKSPQIITLKESMEIAEETVEASGEGDWHRQDYKYIINTEKE